MAQPPPGQEQYVLIQGDDNAPENLSELDTISQTLFWIGFRTDAQRNSIILDSIGSFEDIRMLSEKDITSMATEWAGRTANNGRIVFGTRRTKLIKALVHWVQDFYRVSEIPTVAGINEATFRSHLSRALARHEIRTNLKDGTKTAADAATPGPLESERKWKQWEEKFNNYARAHIGSNGVPLSYIIREKDEPDRETVYLDFISKTIACAPLSGEYYLADRLAVFNMIVSFTTGQPSGDWIKNTLRFSDGRRSMKALRDHFSGEGNASRNIAEADRLKETLHYKSERAMAFETFLTQCQKMYNIYEKEGEPMPDDAKLRFLFKRVQHKDLSSSIDALRAQQTAGINITYTQAANHISTAVSELPEYISKNRNISGVGTSSSHGKRSSDIYSSDGSIITGHFSNWRSLSKEDRAIVIAERKRLGLTGRKSSGSNSDKNGKSDINRINQLSAQNKKYKRQIKALKRQSKIDNVDDGEDDTTNDADIDAGDQFGGKASKRYRKK